MGFFSATVTDNQDLGGGFSWLRLRGCAALSESRPGQFVMLRGAWDRDPLLPRAYSVLWAEGNEAEFLIHRVGRGSRLLASERPGGVIEVRGPLGTSFPDPAAATRQLLVAGGCGLAPLHLAARRAHDAGLGGCVELLAGARSAGELVLLAPLRERGIAVRTATEDGSEGHHGLVTELLARRAAEDPAAAILACGPQGMLLAVREIARRHRSPCYLSAEAEMACGLGACLGCAVPGRGQPYRYVCQDGPVFPAEEVWP